MCKKGNGQERKRTAFHFTVVVYKAKEQQYIEVSAVDALTPGGRLPYQVTITLRQNITELRVQLAFFRQVIYMYTKIRFMQKIYTKEKIITGCINNFLL